MIPHFSDHAANERTYLAWVRTAIAIMAFGFLLERFNLFLSFASANMPHTARHLHLRATEWVGLVLIIFGALIILLASLRFLRYRKEIENVALHPHVGAFGEKLLTSILLVLGLFLVVYVGQELAYFS